jgi:putative hydrolase of the HAD superfamily
MTTRISHVFFDATDTLLRVRGSVGATYARVAQRHGLHIPTASLQQSFLQTIGSVPQDVAPQRSAAEIQQSENRWWTAITRGTFAAHGAVDDFEALFFDLFETFRHAAAWELLPHARETLTQLNSMGVSCGIISDMDSRLLPLLQSFQMDSLLADVYLSFRVGYCKPDARLFTTACASSKAIPQNTVHVGDSWKKDVLAARGAGLHAVWYRPQRSDAAHAPWIADLLELPELLAKHWPL